MHACLVSPLIYQKNTWPYLVFGLFASNSIKKLRYVGIWNGKTNKIVNGKKQYLLHQMIKQKLWDDTYAKKNYYIKEKKYVRLNVAK